MTTAQIYLIAAVSFIGGVGATLVLMQWFGMAMFMCPWVLR